MSRNQCLPATRKFTIDGALFRAHMQLQAKRLRLTTKMVASHTGLSYATIRYNLRTQLGDPRAPTFLVLCEFFKLNPFDYLHVESIAV